MADLEPFHTLGRKKSLEIIFNESIKRLQAKAIKAIRYILVIIVIITAMSYLYPESKGPTP